MQQTGKTEEVFSGWGIGTVIDWQTIQENAARVTLAEGGMFVLKHVGPNDADAVARLHFEYEILRHVEQSGVAAATPMLSDQDVPYVTVSGRLYRLSRWLPNQPATPKTSRQRTRLYRNYGVAIARFHQALATYQDEHTLTRTWRTDLTTRVLDESVPHMLAHLGDGDRAPLEELLDEIQPGMQSAYACLPIQLIIWDCHPGNVAVNGFDVSGFIDSDHVSLAPRIQDLADFLVHLVKWDVGDAQRAQNWLTEFPRFVVGYDAVTPLSSHERLALFYAMAGIPLIFIDFFLQNDLQEPIEVELDVFAWLVRHRSEIAAQLDAE